MNKKSLEYTFYWFVENYRHCWHRIGEKLRSPEFSPEECGGMKWSLLLFPRGQYFPQNGHVSLSLTSFDKQDFPANFPLRSELSIVAADGSIIFTHVTRNEKCVFSNINRVFIKRRPDYLFQGTLRVQCKMWWGEGRAEKIEQCRAVTRIGVQTLSFLYEEESFSSLEPEQSVSRPSTDDEETGYLDEKKNMSSRLYFVYDSGRKGNIIMIEFNNPKVKVISECKFSLLDRSGNKIECGRTNESFDVVRSCIKLRLSLTKEEIMARKTEYLKNDKLSLLGKYTFSAGLEFERIEEVVQGIPSMAVNFFKNSEKPFPSCNVLGDLKAVYFNKYFSDVVVKTKTKSFPAHRVILCARSTVFKAMLTNDMNEKHSGSISIVDLEDDILERLLLFLYSDELGDLEVVEATKLYYAADKYDIRKLKSICSMFLEDNLSLENAVGLLLLADMHSDADLKLAAEDFILEHEIEVYSTDEWNDFVERYPTFANLRERRLKIYADNWSQNFLVSPHWLGLQELFAQLI